MQYATPPPMALWRALLRSNRWKGELPALEATCDALPAPPAAYAAVCGFPDVDPMPLTWPGVACGGLTFALMTAPAFPLPVLGIVHARQTIVRTRHLRAGEPLRARCRTGGHRVVRSGGEFDISLDIEAAEGVVWSGTTTILSRAIPGSGAPRTAPPPAPVWEQVRAVELEIPADSGWRYAAVSGDYNPIHLARYTSFAFGFSRPIAHGWWVLARALVAAGDQLPEACRVDARFVGVVSMPGAVQVRIGHVVDSPHLHIDVTGSEPCIVARVEAL